MKKLILMFLALLIYWSVQAEGFEVTLKDNYKQFVFKESDYPDLKWTYKKYYWKWKRINLNDDELNLVRMKYPIEERAIEWYNRAILRDYFWQKVVPHVNQDWTWATILKTADSWASFSNDVYQEKRLDVVLAAYMLEKALKNQTAVVELPIDIKDPELTFDESLKNMWINGILAVWESDFSRSSWKRITNINVWISKFHWLIVKPWETFSFTKRLWNVGAANWFMKELVIKPSWLTLEYWWWLCQVSTTMYRAAMLSWFDIKQRKNHSFAVFHYDPQWSDSTVYIWVQDLKYINPYSTPILIQWETRWNNAYFVIYWNTKEKRDVKLFGPFFSNYKKALPTVNRYTSGLPKGKKVMVQWWLWWFEANWFRVVQDKVERIFSKYDPIATIWNIWTGPM